MTRYEPLRQYLECIQPAISEESLSFSEIERILGSRLPNSAYEYRAWWSNPSSPADHPHAQSWLKAGWIVDTVNQKDRWVRFRRTRSRIGEERVSLAVDTPPSPSLEKEISSEISSTAPATESKRFLLGFGFEEVGEWLFEGGSLQFRLTQHSNEQNILYAFVAQGEVKYIGISKQTLSGRMIGYKRPGPTQSTNINNNARIKDLLHRGTPVQILAFVQKEEMLYHDVPIDRAAGLEHNLIARLRPPWNSRM
ncbi:MAG: hypothetical protein L7F78_21140 [Syntrophales bacterium LBB04]|nr:hypothetical protein [Syntrophales bacterium LBB04]